MTLFMINDNSPEAVSYRKGLIDTKREDVLQRLNNELENSPFSGLLKIVNYEVERSGFTGYWDIMFSCSDGRRFLVRKSQFFHIHHQSKHRQYRTNNRIKAYLAVVALMLRKYSLDVNDYYIANFTLL